ncbi:zinc finger protein 26 [Stomoxys calcitrans]|uniref:zinc finger protein 26 n=1 Tax=Stomoxys calcitrans TaxID=35570 RepID=UPI0027E385DE|nr:zinc finger protein 26 [Stomoxys calcitrans]
MLKHLPPADYCRLCVKCCNDYQRSLYDEAGQANADHELVGKYFTNEMLNMEWERRLQYICEKCWQHVWEFHQFQQSVIEAQRGPHLHKEASNEVGEVKIKSEVNVNQRKVQLEMHSGKGLSISTEDLMKSTPLTFKIKTEEPLDLNSDYDGFSSHGCQLRDDEEVGEVKIKSEVNINQQEVQPELHICKGLSTSSEDLMKSTALSFDIKTEEPLDLNSDYDGMSSQGLEQLATDEEVSLMDTSLINDIESNEDYSSNDDISLSSSRQSKFATERSVEVFDELVALWRSSLSCEICHQLVASYSQLKEHFSKNHASENCYLMCCQLRLETHYDIENHIHYHNAPQQLKCEACCKAYRLEEDLRVHKRKVHTSMGKAEDSEKLQGKYRCCKCSKDFATKRNLVRHNCDVHKPKIFECNLCQKSFMHPHTLREHLAAHTGNKTHACSVCPEAFTRRAYLCRHMRKHHIQEWKKLQNESGQKVTLDGYRREIRGECVVYVCRYCSMEYDNRHSMSNHLRQCQKYDRPIDPRKGFRRETRGESKVFVCNYCSKEYEKRQSIHGHIRRCQRDKGSIESKRGFRRETRGESTVYVCSLCSKECRFRKSMHNHLKQCQEEHGQIEPKRGYRLEFRGECKVYVCNYCSKEYEKRQAMLTHNRYCQGDDKPIEPIRGCRLEARGEIMVYICIYCSQEYEKRQSMRSHIHRIHRDKRPTEPKMGYRLETRGESKVYICIYCSKEYKKRQSMRTHLLRHHGDDESLAVQTSINSEPPVPAEQQQKSLYTSITVPKTTDEDNTTPDGDILNVLGKKGLVEKYALMTPIEGKELNDEYATGTKVKTEQFSTNTKTLVKEEMDAHEMPTEFEEVNCKIEEFINCEQQEY